LAAWLTKSWKDEILLTMDNISLESPRGHSVGTEHKSFENLLAFKAVAIGNLCFDIAGVASSILATPTIKRLPDPSG
jgi:hypothetical protein